MKAIAVLGNTDEFWLCQGLFLEHKGIINGRWFELVKPMQERIYKLTPKKCTLSYKSYLGTVTLIKIGRSKYELKIEDFDDLKELVNNSSEENEENIDYSLPVECQLDVLSQSSIQMELDVFPQSYGQEELDQRQRNFTHELNHIAQSPNFMHELTCLDSSTSELNQQLHHLPQSPNFIQELTCLDSSTSELNQQLHHLVQSPTNFIQELTCLDSSTSEINQQPHHLVQSPTNFIQENTCLDSSTSEINQQPHHLPQSPNFMQELTCLDSSTSELNQQLHHLAQSPNFIQELRCIGQNTDDLNQELPNFELSSCLPSTSVSNKELHERGFTYVCSIPKCPNKIIKQSRLKRHITRYHSDLLHLSEKMGGKNIVQIENLIRMDTASRISNKSSMTICTECNKAVLDVTRHKRRVHKIFALQCKKNVGSCIYNTIMEERTRRIPKTEPLLQDMERFLQTVSGGQVMLVTAKSKSRYLRCLFADVELDIIDILDESHRFTISEKLTEYSLQSFAKLNGTVGAISSLLSYFLTSYSVHLQECGYTVHLQALEHQVALWLKTCGKEKKKYKTQLKNRLDDSIVGADEIRELHTAMSHLYENAISKKASQENRAEYLAVSFTFQKGNAGRPGIVDTATLSEYKAWRDQYSKCPTEIPNFRIHSHKTSSTSGAARVHIYDNSVNVLLRYGDERVELEERFKNIPIHPYAARNENSRKFVDPGLKLFQFTTSFTDHWAKIRRRYPKMNNLTHTMYRFFVETLNKQKNSTDMQRAVSHNLNHTESVAAQSYMATTSAMSRKGAELIENNVAEFLDENVQDGRTKIKKSKRNFKKKPSVAL